MIGSVTNFAHNTLCPALQSIGDGLSTVGSGIQTCITKVYTYCVWLDKKVACLTDRHLPKPAAVAAQLFFHLAPYIAAALFLPTIPSLLTGLAIFSIKAIATKGSHLDTAGLSIGEGLRGTIYGAMRVSKIVAQSGTILAPPGIRAVALILLSSLIMVSGVGKSLYDRTEHISSEE